MCVAYFSHGQRGVPSTFESQGLLETHGSFVLIYTNWCVLALVQSVCLGGTWERFSNVAHSYPSWAVELKVISLKCILITQTVIFHWLGLLRCPGCHFKLTAVIIRWRCVRVCEDRCIPLWMWPLGKVFFLGVTLFTIIIKVNCFCFLHFFSSCAC